MRPGEWNPKDLQGHVFLTWSVLILILILIKSRYLDHYSNSNFIRPNKCRIDRRVIYFLESC